MQAVAVQPIAIYFMVDSSFTNYAGGVYTPTTCTTTTNHIMLAVGYDTTGPTPFWIIKNSWGGGWGEGGYARVKMTGDYNGPCGMYGFAVYPSVSGFANCPETPIKTVLAGKRRGLTQP